MFYSGIALGEIGKPLQLRNETVYVILLASAYGVKLHFPAIALAYLAIFIMLVVIGKIIVKVGMVKYNNTIGNFQNPELMSIIERLDRIENKINEPKA